MRIMLDTNVLISALLFPSQKFNSIMEYIFAEHELVLSSYVVRRTELHIGAAGYKYLSTVLAQFQRRVFIRYHKGKQGIPVKR